MTFVKICGITNLEDALLSVAAGADALGFNFYRRSPRYIEPETAREIISRLPSHVMSVGVFVSEPTPEAVDQLASQTGVVAVQLHGDESPEFCRSLTNRFVIKALTAGKEFTPKKVLEYKVQAVLLDAFDENKRGGTGRVIDWTLARKTRELIPKLFLAGGLAPENIGEAIAAVRPYGVDACSALEITPGRKDPKRLEAFVKSAHAADAAVKR